MSETKENQNLLLDWIFKILGALVIPLFLWGISLHLDVSNLKKDIEQCQALDSKIDKIEENARANTTILAGTREKLKYVQESISETKRWIERNYN